MPAEAGPGAAVVHWAVAGAHLRRCLIRVHVLRLGIKLAFPSPASI